MDEHYSATEQAQLLAIARYSLESATAQQPLPSINLESLSTSLRAVRACFVTLEIDHSLRGCTGVLVARRPLALEVNEMTVQSAFYDPRFPPVTKSEVSEIEIEISVLTPPKMLQFERVDDIPQLIRPHIDGVTFRLGNLRSTFLPQVWEQLPDPVQFLGHLSRKMGLSTTGWRQPQIEVETYQAIVFRESENRHLQS